MWLSYRQYGRVKNSVTSPLVREGRRGFLKTDPISQKNRELRLLPINNQALRITDKRKIMISNLSLSTLFDTLIEIDDNLLLCKQSDIYQGVFGNDLCDYDILIKGDNGLLMQPNEQVNYSSAYFDDLYERVQPGNVDDNTVYMDSDFDFDKITVRKLSEIPTEIKQSFVDVEHGINTDEICVTDAHVIYGKVYEAPLHTSQDYPTQEYEDAFMFVDEEGNKRYIKRTSPFFADEQRDVFDDITEQEFKEFCE